MTTRTVELLTNRLDGEKAFEVCLYATDRDENGKIVAEFIADLANVSWLPYEMVLEDRHRLKLSEENSKKIALMSVIAVLGKE